MVFRGVPVLKADFVWSAGTENFNHSDGMWFNRKEYMQEERVVRMKLNNSKVLEK